LKKADLIVIVEASSTKRKKMKNKFIIHDPEDSSVKNSFPSKANSISDFFLN